MARNSGRSIGSALVVALLLALLAAVPAQAAPPANDEKANATPITGLASGRTDEATTAASDPAEAGGATVWFQYTLPTASAVHLDTCGSDFDTKLAIVGSDGAVKGSNDDDPSASCASNTSSAVDTAVLPAGTYFVAVGGFVATTTPARGSFSLRIGRRNDDLVGAIRIATGSVTDGTTVGMTTETGESSLGNRSVWYRLIPLDSGRITVDTCATAVAHDTVVGVFVGGTTVTQRALVENDDDATCGSARSRVQFNASAGTTYNVRVGTFGSSPPAAFRLTVSAPGALTGTPPGASTQPATAIGATTARVNATVAPNGSSTGAYFEYGTTPSYGSISTESASGVSGDFGVNVTGLQSNTRYHFRPVAYNATDRYATGADATFLTGPGAPTVLGVAPATTLALPSDDNAPLVRGTAEGATVGLFDNSTCSGTAIGFGTVADFGATGITANVPGNARTTIYARATNASGNSACSSTFKSYWEDSTRPAAPTVTSTSPTGNDNAPEVFGNAEAAGTVTVYTVGNCRGTVAATGSSSQFSSPGLTTRVGDETSTTFYATATDAAGNVSPCSSTSATFVEDSPGTPPGSLRYASQTGGPVLESNDGAVLTATDASGNLWTTDYANHRVQVFSPSGTVVRTLGGPPDADGRRVPGSGNGEFNLPEGVAFDSAGNVYVADCGNHRVQKFNAAGAYLLQWGTSGTGNGQFGCPFGIAVDPSDRVFVADADRVQRFSSAGAYQTQWGTSGSLPGQFFRAGAVATDSQGNVYVGDIDNDRVQRFDASGTVLAPAGGWSVDTPGGLDVDAADRVYAVTQFPCSIVRTNATGGDRTTVVHDCDQAEFSRNSGYGVAVSGGTIYVSDTYSQTYAWSTDGVFKRSFGVQTEFAPGEFRGVRDVTIGAGGDVFATDIEYDRDLSGIYFAENVQRLLSDGGTVARFDGAPPQNDPSGFRLPTPGLDADAAGDLYLAERDRGDIHKVTAAGAHLADIGFGDLDDPQDVAVSASGDVYALDSADASGRSHVRVFSASGTKVNEFGPLGGGDGRLRSPHGIALDSAGRVYVVDTGNDRVQVYGADGTFLRHWGDTGSGPGDFDDPQQVAVDSADNVYVTDAGTCRVQKFRPTGAFVEAFGTCGESPAAGQLSGLGGVAVDAAGRVFLALQRDQSFGVYDNDHDRVVRLRQVDLAPPDTTLSGVAQNGATTDDTPTFTFASTESGGLGFECRLDGATEYTPCASPYTPPPLNEGAHTLRVRAVDAAGNPDPSPVVRDFRVDTVAPGTAITSGPSGPTGDPTPTWAFESEDGQGFQCSVDGAAFATCTSPYTSARLGDGAHTFAVRAVDAAGNVDPTPATRTITVATGGVSITAGTLSVTAAPGATDNLRITKPTSTTLTVTDNANTGYAGAGLRAGPGCTQVGDARVDCPSAGVTALNASSGDLDDKLVDDVPALPATLNGGPDDDRIYGGPGNDVIDGGTGADDISGRAGTDRATYATRSEALTITLNDQPDDGGAADADDAAARRDNVRTDVEQATGGSGADVITGNQNANLLQGGDGPDTLSGDLGNDVLDGGAGPDSLVGGSGTDTADYGSRTQPVIVTGDGVANDGDATDGATTRDNVAIDVEILQGGSGNDQLTGGTAANTIRGGPGDDVLNGGSGADVLDGQGGADDLDGGTGSTDTATYAGRSEAVTVTIGAGADDGSAADGNGTRRDDVLAGTEFVQGGNGNDTLTGSSIANRLSGGAGNDALAGGAGTDTLDGETGDDSLDGQADADILIGGPGADDLIGGLGVDLADYSAATLPVTVTVGDATANDGSTADVSGARRDNVDATTDNVTGGSGADDLTGNALANTLTGGAGADRLNGLDGRDVINANDSVVDTLLDCGLGAPDIANVDAADPASTGCETINVF